MNMTVPKRATIITVVRNAASVITTTIDSVVASKSSDIEYIVVDGKSTDGTTEIAQKRRDVVDVVISEPDRGIYDAMNKGIAAANGKWLLFLNAGDRLRPGMLETMLAEAEHHRGRTALPASVIAGRVSMVDENGTDLGYMHPNRIGDAERLLHENCVAHQATLVLRSLFQLHGVYSLDYRINGDYEYWIRLLKAGEVFAFYPHVVSDFAITGISSQRTSFPHAKREQLDILVQHGYLSKRSATLKYAKSMMAYHFKTAIRLLLGPHISRAISLARSRRV